jgi:hypothetical protein
MGLATFRWHREALARAPRPPTPLVRDPLAELTADNAALRAKLADLEALLAQATAPEPPAPERRPRR